MHPRDPRNSFDYVLSLLEKFGKTDWDTQDGKTIPIVDLPDSHLLNTIRMLIRKDKVATLYFHSLLPEAKARGIWTDAEKMSWRLQGISGKLWELIK